MLVARAGFLQFQWSLSLITQAGNTVKTYEKVNPKTPTRPVAKPPKQAPKTSTPDLAGAKAFTFSALFQA